VALEPTVTSVRGGSRIIPARINLRREVARLAWPSASPAWSKPMSFPRAALFSLLLSPIALAGNGKPESAGLSLEFHSLRSAAAQKSQTDSLKPKLPQPQYVPIEMTLRLHTHDDGKASMACDVDHSIKGTASTAEPRAAATGAQP
jgi:hypothetical protein